MSDNNVCFKLVSVLDDNEFMSFSTMNEYKVRYKVGLETFPVVEDTPLFAFDNVTDLLRYWERTGSNDKVFLCEYSDVFTKKNLAISPVFDFWTGFTFDDLKNEWKRIIEKDVDCNTKIIFYGTSTCYIENPRGTILVKSITLVRELTRLELCAIEYLEKIAT